MVTDSVGIADLRLQIADLKACGTRRTAKPKRFKNLQSTIFNLQLTMASRGQRQSRGGRPVALSERHAGCASRGRWRRRFWLLSERLSLILMEETGTLGVRAYPCMRHILARKTTLVEVEVEGIKEQINVKVSMDNEGKILQIKPEYDDVRRIADRTGEPLRKVMDQVLGKAMKTEKVKSLTTV